MNVYFNTVAGTFFISKWHLTIETKLPRAVSLGIRSYISLLTGETISCVDNVLAYLSIAS